MNRGATGKEVAGLDESYLISAPGSRQEMKGQYDKITNCPLSEVSSRFSQPKSTMLEMESHELPSLLRLQRWDVQFASSEEKDFAQVV